MQTLSLSKSLQHHVCRSQHFVCSIFAGSSRHLTLEYIHSSAAHGPDMQMNNMCHKCLIGLLLWGQLCTAIDKSELFPYSDSDPQLPASDDSCSPVNLSNPIVFYDQSYHTIYVSLSCRKIYRHLAKNVLDEVKYDFRFRSTTTAC